MKRKVQTSKLVDFARGRLSSNDSLTVLDEVESSDAGSVQLETIIEVMNASEERPDMLYPETSHAFQGERKSEGLIDRLLQPRRMPSPAFAVAGVVVVILGVLLGIRVSTRDYYALSETEDLRIESVVRGPGAEDFEVARQRIERNDLEGAIHMLERYTRAFPDGIGSDYAHYCAGALYLKTARRTVFLVIPNYNTEDVNLGLAHLSAAVQETRNPILAEHAYILRAKAFVMINRPEAAIEELKKGLEYKGPRESEIRTLIQKLVER